MERRNIFIVLQVLSCMISVIHADIYLHNPRGSNNRNDEASRGRRNANRLFDSQNNNRGGYNVANSIYYYVGSKLDIQWTNQHSCNDPNANCEIIIQYMCHDQLRDGNTTGRIPTNQDDCVDNDCNSDERFGMHETFEQYQNCMDRERNKGLFTADQNLKRNDARSTRQNPKGTRRAYECPEERDYYPYWQPTDWKDIVVMTGKHNEDCDMYKTNSQNTASKWICDPPANYKEIRKCKNKKIPITKEKCEEFQCNGNFSTWTEVPSHNLGEVDCIESKWSRDNHHGNGKNSIYPNTYQWTVPDTPHQHCAIRIRYNISTNDFPSNTFADKNGDEVTGVDIANLVGLSQEEATERGYEYKNDPIVDMFGDEGDMKLELALAINTAQFGRTFQDRTHSFEIRARPEEIPDSAVIHNVNVRGKRGNIVQTYPAVEYDFVPNVLMVVSGDYIHFQWDGSDTNPGNNAGEGTKSTDRSNVLVLHEQNYPEDTYSGTPLLGTPYGHWGNSYPWVPINGVDSNGNPTPTFLGLSNDDKIKLALNDEGANVGELLNDAQPYFDLGAKQISAEGIFHYFSTRNNNFSNRSQKGKIIVVGAAAAENNS